MTQSTGIQSGLSENMPATYADSRTGQTGSTIVKALLLINAQIDTNARPLTRLRRSHAYHLQSLPVTRWYTISAAVWSLLTTRNQPRKPSCMRIWGI